MDKKKITISENNVFHKNRAEIAAICASEGCEVGTGARIWAHENGVAYGDDLKEFEQYVHALHGETAKEHNLVRRYFAGDQK